MANLMIGSNQVNVFPAISLFHLRVNHTMLMDTVNPAMTFSLVGSVFLYIHTEYSNMYSQVHVLLCIVMYYHVLLLNFM